FTREAYRDDPSGMLLESWSKAHAGRDDLHMRISLVGRDGRVMWSNTGSAPGGEDVADQAAFRAQQQSRDDRMRISGPVRDGRAGTWTIQFSRVLPGPDGSFDGIATVSLDLRLLSRFYQSISIGNGAVLLATTDGTILVRAPRHGELSGGALSPSVVQRVMHSIVDGPYWIVSPIDHVQRIVSARRVEHYPLVLSVGLASADVFATYRRTQRLYLGAGLLASVACVLSGLVMLRQRQSLLDSRQALSATLENMSQGIAMVRPDGSVPVLNNRAIHLLALPPALLKRQPTYQQIVDWQVANREFGNPACWPGGLEETVRAIGRHGDYTYERTRPNGTVLEVRTLGLADGGMVRTLTDISERKRQEAALAAAQARAAHAERMQALGQLAGGIAHDFNNILQAVQGGATLIDSRAGDLESVRRFARMILGATERGTAITQRLLAFARRGELRAEPVEPAELLAGLRDVLLHTLGSGIAVEVASEDGVPPLLADKRQLETVLVNLATNARDAMPDGGTLTLLASGETVDEETNHPAELAAGAYVRLTVADTGAGMDEAVLARVLEPFFSTKPAGKGTGLGLSMAKGFAEQSGGGLAICSRPGRGTTIRLWLPVASALEAPLVPATLSGVGPEGQVRRVLLVDDEAMVRETLARSLEDEGYHVTIATDGAEALALLRSDMAVDVLVTDLSMPNQDGLAVIRQAQAEREGLPSVLLTGYAGPDTELAAGGLANGAFFLVRKPVTAAHLAERIEALLGARVVG
ncbi:MAG TPA: PAS-domain containing protein, partial [Rhodopila sp.]|nr:PAS-domain containing protein [Rhodopila sp.]